MPRQQLPPGIKKISVRDRRTGKPVVRYQVVADTGTNADTGRRQQTRLRFVTEKEARAAHAAIQNGVAAGTYVSRSSLTVDQACANWLIGRHGIRPTTRAAYEHALAPLRERHGGMPVQQLGKEQIDRLVDDLKAGRCPGQRKGWTANSINPMLNLVSAVLSDLVKQGRLVRDVAALVSPMKRPRSKLKTFSESEVQQLLAYVESDRLGHAWHLALSGLRRGELCGLRWEAVDLDVGTVSVTRERLAVNGEAMEFENTKTDPSVRTLPLSANLLAALRRAQHIQKRERLALGPDYGPGEHVVCNEAGYPYHPDTISHFWNALCKKADVPSIRLHDARHTCGTLLHLQGEPVGVVALWLGHADPAFTLRTYIHPNSDALKSAATALQRVVTRS